MKKAARLSKEKGKGFGKIALRRTKEGVINTLDEEEFDIKEPQKKHKDCSKKDKKHSKDTAVAETAPTQKRNSKEKKSKEKDKPSKEKRRTSSENSEREKEFPGASSHKVVVAARAFCKYLLDMKESSLSTYFDEHLVKYQPSSDNSCTEWEKHMTKNRSKEHKMYDHSRIQLETTTPDESDYINASFVKFDNSDTHFIMTQYPLPDTLQDFWRMVSQKRALRVISIFEPFVDEAIEEFNKISCAVPPPLTTTSGNDSQTGGQELHVNRSRQEIVHNSVRCEPHSLKSFFPVDSQHYMNLNGWLINTQKAETEGRDRKRLSTYTVEIVADECSEAYYARIFNCATWPWKQVPSDERKLLALTRAPWKEMLLPIKNNDPVVVMCDLGLDRSATVVLTTILIELVMSGKPPDCDALFKKMRDQRAGCFTMSMYYTYAIHTALFYLKIKFKDMTEIPEDVKTMINESLIKVPFVKKV